jgi:2-polyprenyl-3-methyl-5-hydroxy-6-metoxy-1,4-benzoquinol methylase
MPDGRVCSLALPWAGAWTSIRPRVEAADLETRRQDELAYQARYFDMAKNQYPRAAVVTPPRHTAVESQAVLDRLKDVPADGVIIDFGAGTGRLSIPLARAGYAVLAVDASERSLAALEETARGLGLHAVDTSSTLPGRGSFSAIVGSDVLHHVDLEVQLPRIHGLLRAGGKVAFSEPGAFNPSWYVYLALFHELRVERRIVTCNLLHLRRVFERHGFRNVRITGLGLLPRPLFGWAHIACTWHDALGNWPIVRWFAYRYVIEASK